MSLPPLPRKPEARTEKIEDLVERVRRGEVRVPRFQRGLRWGSENVVELFDSIYRGYPVGSLLFYKRPAPAQRLEIGPIKIDAPESSEAWWVVDGQQRVTVLAGCLTRSTPLPTKPNSQDPYVLYFDVTEQAFYPPLHSGEIPSRWVPLPHLLDATHLSEWIYKWQHQQDESLRQAVFEAGKRIREYSIPLYLIETVDREITQQIFYRTNQAGKPLEWADVYNALFGEEDVHPSTIDELSTELASVGLGRLTKERLLTSLLALRGKDPTRDLDDHLRQDREVLRNASSEALPVLRSVLSFLRRDAGILHLRLLPQSTLLDVLTRFFTLHRDPEPRTRILLSRWFWRANLGAGRYEERTLRRRGINAVVEDAEASVQNLLELVGKERPPLYELPETFDARAAASRLSLLALAHLGPRDLASGREIDVAGLLEEQDKDAFVKILHRPDSELGRSPANRMIQDRDTKAHHDLAARIAANGPGDPVLASHAIPLEAAKRLANGDFEGFLAARAQALTEAVWRLTERQAAWDHSDRPSVEHILAEVEAEA